MNDFTQISGNIRPGNTALYALKSLLSLVGIKVAHPSQDESLFYETDTKAIWRHYDRELAFYQSIANSPFHIVYNDAPIDSEIATQIIYAMLKNRPILMTGTPVFAETLAPLSRDTINKHIHYVHSINLADLELTELSMLLAKLKPIDYSFSKQEKVLMRALIRAHFRNILAESREARLAKSRSPIHPTEEV